MKTNHAKLKCEMEFFISFDLNRIEFSYLMFAWFYFWSDFVANQVAVYSEMILILRRINENLGVNAIDR